MALPLARDYRSYNGYTGIVFFPRVVITRGSDKLLLRIITEIELMA